MRSFGAPVKGWSLVSGEAEKLRDYVLCALWTAACGIVAIYLPPLSLPVSIVLPSFPALLTVRRNVLTALTALIAAAILVGLVVAPQGAGMVWQAELLLMMPAGLSGLLLGLVFKNRLGATRGMLTVLAGQFLFTGAAWTWYWGISGYNPLSSAGLQTALNQALGSYLNTGSALTPTLNNFSHLMVFLWPGIQVAGLAAQIGAAYLWTRYRLARTGGPVPVMLPFGQWHLPWYSIWSLIAGLGLVLAGPQFGWPAAYRLGGNLLYVVAQVYLVVGISVLVFHLRRLPGMKVLKVLLVLALVIDPQVGAPLLIVAGVLDSIVNLRRKPGKTS
jgi:hypothetical protein